MSKRYNIDLINTVSSTITGEKKIVNNIGNKTVGVSISGTATVQLFGFIGEIKSQMGSDITASGLFEIPALLDEVSADVSAYTNGSISVKLIGD